MDLMPIIDGALGWLALEGSWVVVGAVATALFTGWAVIQRMTRTPRPHWEFVDAEATDDGTFPADGETRPTAFVFINSGDAPAWRVTVNVLVPSQSRYLQTSRPGRVLPGETIEYNTIARARHEDRSRNKLMAGDGVWLDSNETRLRISWNHRPGWWIRRQRTFSLDRVQYGHTYRTRPYPTPIAMPDSQA